MRGWRAHCLSLRQSTLSKYQQRIQIGGPRDHETTQFQIGVDQYNDCAVEPVDGLFYSSAKLMELQLLSEQIHKLLSKVFNGGNGNDFSVTPGIEVR